MVAVWEGGAHHFVCKLGGGVAVPPLTAPVLESHVLAVKNTCHEHLCRRGLQTGLPQTHFFVIHAYDREDHVIAMFAAKGG